MKKTPCRYYKRRKTCVPGNNNVDIKSRKTCVPGKRCEEGLPEQGQQVVGLRVHLMPIIIDLLLTNNND